MADVRENTSSLSIHCKSNETVVEKEETETDLTRWRLPIRWHADLEVTRCLEQPVVHDAGWTGGSFAHCQKALPSEGPID